MRLIIWWLVATLIAIAAHELGHLLWARIAFLSIGAGPRLFGGKFGELQWEFRALPFSGFVVPRRVVVSTPRMILFYLGGILGNAAVIGVVAVLDQFGLLQKWPAFTKEGASPFVFVQVISIVVNLTPFRFRLAGSRLLMRSDGLRIFDLVRGFFKRKPETDPAYQALFQRYHTGGPLRPSAVAPQIIEQLRRDEKAWPQVKAFLLETLDSAALPPAEELHLLDKLLTAGLANSTSGRCAPLRSPRTSRPSSAAGARCSPSLVALRKARFC
jgi:hypothetical protein